MLLFLYNDNIQIYFLIASMKKTFLLYGIVWLFVFFIAGCTLPRNKQEQGHGAAWDLGLLDDFEDTDTSTDVQSSIVCLKDKEVTFYGCTSCWFSCEDVATHGNQMKNFACIDCDENESLCDAIGISELPAWVNPSNGQIEYDITSLDELIKVFDCVK